MLCGWVLQLFTTTLQWDLIRSYRAIYFGYAAIGLLKLILTLLLTHSVESAKKQQQGVRERSNEAAPLLGERANRETELIPEARRGIRSLLPEISKDSVSVVTTLCLLMTLDSFGTGLSPL